MFDIVRRLFQDIFFGLVLQASATTADFHEGMRLRKSAPWLVEPLMAITRNRYGCRLKDHLINRAFPCLADRSITDFIWKYGIAPLIATIVIPVVCCCVCCGCGAFFFLRHKRRDQSGSVGSGGTRGSQPAGSPGPYPPAPNLQQQVPSPYPQQPLQQPPPSQYPQLPPYNQQPPSALYSQQPSPGPYSQSHPEPYSQPPPEPYKQPSPSAPYPQ